MNEFAELIDLAARRVGGAVIAANDEFFASKENLLRESAPVFVAGKYTDRGKWMDGWETRRRRTAGHDWCIIRLGLPGIVKGVVVDTAHFKGNYPEACSIDACALPANAAPELLERAPWRELLGTSLLQGDARNAFAIAPGERSTHLRLNIYPDGGVARLHVHGEVRPDWERLLARGGPVDLAAVEHGGRVLAASDMYFGHRHNLIMPGRAAGMADGWETRRRRGPGHDWVVIGLGRAGEIRRVEVDTLHFKGNAPGSCMLEVARAAAGEVPAGCWRELLPPTALQPDTLHVFEGELRAGGAATHVRLNIYPDGGVSRLRVFADVQ